MPEEKEKKGRAVDNSGGPAPTPPKQEKSEGNDNPPAPPAEKTEKNPTPPAQKPGPLSEPKNEKTVSVKESVLEALVKKVEDQGKKLEMLTYAADKSRVAAWDERNRSGELIRTAKITKWQGKYVIGWQSVKDEVSVVNGVLREKQVVKLYMHEGPDNEPSTEEMDFLYFFRNKDTEIGNIIKRSQTNAGETFVLQFEDGQQIEVDTKFIN